MNEEEEHNQMIDDVWNLVTLQKQDDYIPDLIDLSDHNYDDILNSPKNHEENPQIKKSPSQKQEQENQISSSLLYSESEEIHQKLRKQIEFYMSDSNLIQDTFLQNQLKSAQYSDFIDLKLFQSFKKIQQIFKFHKKTNQKQQQKALQTALQSSKHLILNKSQTKLKRAQKFDLNNLESLQKNHDKTKIYIENLPQQTTHNDLNEIFSKPRPIPTQTQTLPRKILHIQLPKHKKTNLSKGFAFIEFSTEKEAIEAQKEYNNFLPNKMLEIAKGQQTSLKVMLKNDWNEAKQDLKIIKNEIFQHKEQKKLDYLQTKIRQQDPLKENLLQSQQNLANLPQNSSSTEQILPKKPEIALNLDQFVELEVIMKPNTVLKLKHLNAQILKETLKLELKSHKLEPSYLDFRNNINNNNDNDNENENTENKGGHCCYLRYCKEEMAREALKYIQESQICLSVQLLQGEEEREYWKEVEQMKNNHRRHLFTKKIQKQKQTQKKQNQNQYKQSIVNKKRNFKSKSKNQQQKEPEKQQQQEKPIN